MRHLRTLASIVDVAQSGSIRRSAERLNIAPSALTRKIQEFELELGTPVFERKAQGMRLNAAGELLIQHARRQVKEMEQLRGRIAELQGIRRGHVAIACSQAFAHGGLPRLIAAYRQRHGLVSFEVKVRDHRQAVAALLAYEVDLALILQPPPAAEMAPLMVSEQTLCALVARDHALAGSTGTVRLRDCLRYPLALPDRSLAIRHVLDPALVRLSTRATVAVESGSQEFLRGYVRREHAVAFQVSGGIPAGETDLAVRALDRRDVPGIKVVLGQLRGRTLSVAAAKFADGLAASLHGGL